MYFSHYFTNGKAKVENFLGEGNKVVYSRECSCGWSYKNGFGDWPDNPNEVAETRHIVEMMQEHLAGKLSIYQATKEAEATLKAEFETKQGNA